MKCTKLLSCRQFLREFHYSRFWFTFSDWRALVYIPWLPYKWMFQVFHIFYRWVMAFYFAGWHVASGLQYASSEGRYLIFLTNWAFVAFNIYLFVAAFSVTAKFISVHLCSKADYGFDRTSDYLFEKPKGCCGYGSNHLSWYQMLHWASYALFGEVAVIVTILYWVVLYRAGIPVDGVSANTHLVNGIVSALDVLLFGVPVTLLQVVYPMAFGATYSVFTGIYWGANGTNSFNGGRYIYPVLNYGENPEISSTIIVLTVFLFIPVVHLLLYALYLLRFWLVYAIYGRSKISCWGQQAFEDKDEKDEAIEMKA